jgi:hypothetical protein
MYQWDAQVMTSLQKTNPRTYLLSPELITWEVETYFKMRRDMHRLGVGRNFMCVLPLPFFKKGDDCGVHRVLHFLTCAVHYFINTCFTDPHDSDIWACAYFDSKGAVHVLRVAAPFL